MDEMIPALIVIAISIAVSISKNKARNQKKSQRHPYQPAGGNLSTEEWVRKAEKILREADLPETVQGKPVVKPAPAKTAVPTAPAAPGMSMATSLHAAAPMVHEHLEPACETHDVGGSLPYKNVEGVDPCHEEQLSGMRKRPEAPSASAQGGLTLDWSGRGMVNAFVMQEILTRPADRRRMRG